MTDAPTDAPLRSRLRVRRSLLIALALSVAFHVIVTFWPELPRVTEPERSVLRAELLPPPPAPVPPKSAAPPRPEARSAPAHSEPRPSRPKPRPRVAKPPSPTPVEPLPARVPPPVPAEESVLAADDAPKEGTVDQDAAAAVDADAASAASAAASAGQPLAPIDANSPPVALPAYRDVPPASAALPPVVDLMYSASWGTASFVIGTIGYRFEHDGHRYRIETLGTGRGIVALLYPGQLRVSSTGTMTDEGLLPEELRIQRPRGSVEVAHFDRAAGTLTLHDKPPQPLEPHTYDLLTFWLQFYFAPPAGDEIEFRVATTRQVREYRMRRAGIESVVTPLGEVEAYVWRRVGEAKDGADAVVWLAPIWRFLPVKIRLATRRGSVEQVLIGIRNGIDVPEAVAKGRHLELPVDEQGHERPPEVIPSEARNTP